MSTIPLPGTGFRPFMFLAAILAIFARRKNIKPRDILCQYVLIVSAVLLAFISGKKSVYMLIAASGWIIALLLANKQSIKLTATMWFHLVTFALSWISLTIVGEDLVSLFFNVESRHAVHYTSFISYRASGVFSEPSTFGANMLLLSFAASDDRTSKQSVMSTQNVFTFLSILSVSSVSILAIIILVKKYAGYVASPKRIMPLIAICTVVAYPAYLASRFMIDKTRLYSTVDIYDIKRINIMTEIGSLTWAGLPDNIIESYVIYDLGPLVSPVLMVGIFSFPVVIYLLRSVIAKNEFIVIALTKISITNPLLWVVIQKLCQQKQTL
jgi:hypothetical protein